MNTNTARGPREKASNIALVSSSEGSGVSVAWLTPVQAAERIAVGVEFIYDACAKEGLKHVRLLNRPRGAIRIRTEWLDEWMLQSQRENR